MVKRILLLLLATVLCAMGNFTLNPGTTSNTFERVDEGRQYRITGAGTWAGATVTIEVWSTTLNNWAPSTTLTSGASSKTVIATGPRFRASISGGGGTESVAVEFLRLPGSTFDNTLVNAAIAEDPAASREAIQARRNQVVSHGCVIGDSTVADYPAISQNSVASYLLLPTGSQGASTVTSLAVAGHTIAQQKAEWVADANKATYDWILVEVGLNDVQPDVPTATTLAAYQDLIDTINAGKKENAVVIAAAMTPCKARLITLYGAIDGATSFAKWEAMNAAIMGGTNAITGVDYRVDSHVAILDRGDGNLATCYQVAVPDDVHQNEEARKAMASEWAKVLNRAGFWVSAPEGNFDRNWSQNGTYALLKGNRLGINTRSPGYELDIQATPTQSGAVAARVRQGNAGSVNYALFQIASNGGTGQLLTTSSTWSTSGVNFQSGFAVTHDGSGGLSLGATHASGAVRFYSGGTTARGSFKSSGQLNLTSAAIPNYADDTAADAALASGDLYTTTAGGRTVFRKP